MMRSKKRASLDEYIGGGGLKDQSTHEHDKCTVFGTVQRFENNVIHFVFRCSQFVSIFNFIDIVCVCVCICILQHCSNCTFRSHWLPNAIVQNAEAIIHDKLVHLFAFRALETTAEMTRCIYSIENTQKKKTKTRQCVAEVFAVQNVSITRGSNISIKVLFFVCHRTKIPWFYVSSMCEAII